jgi:hypothetical protein
MNGLDAGQRYRQTRIADAERTIVSVDEIGVV